MFSEKEKCHYSLFRMKPVAAVPMNITRFAMKQQQRHHGDQTLLWATRHGDNWLVRPRVGILKQRAKSLQEN